ncbi:MAG TPA: sigma 54-interacting transcriptional regulator, partial [Kofleriaceae bacterium]|nr:sigma 54-interacting transcriptional regulator [Kofleriaceae bacterium]
ADISIDDRRMSRRHVELSREAGRWRIRDLDSHNGTYVDGVQITGTVERTDVRVVRAGDTLLVGRPDLGTYERATMQLDGAVVGPTLQATYAALDAVARAGTTLHIIGETGSGKELAARRYHEVGSNANGPFVAVNCAAIPTTLAEGMLFGVRKGAYSGADADRDGYFAAADTGTLFLDEIGELALDVQAKLLRVIETKQVVALGSTKARTVEVRVCSATHRDLRGAVADGSFREDLFYRLGRPTVVVPPLRERPEDIAYLTIAAAGRVAPKLAVHGSLVEQLLLRPWPGNVRELLAEVADAAGRAVAARAEAITAEHLADEAGTAVVAKSDKTVELDAATVTAALERSNGNVAAAARDLGVHRNQLRRFLAKSSDS